MKEFTYQEYLEYQKEISKKEEKERKEEEEYIRGKVRKVNNPHDKIFRIYLDNREEVVKIINRKLELKKKLEKEEIEKYNSSFVNKRYENRESDVVYKKKDQKIFFLIEHQTSIDYSMPKRILEYEIEIIDSNIEHKKKMRKEEKLPTVIPLVIYTGKKKWDVAKYIEECQEKLEGTKVPGLGNYYVIDINEYSKKELEEDELFFSKILLIEKARTEEELIEVLGDIVKKVKDEKSKEELKRMIYYIYQEKIGEEKTKELIEKLKEGENMKLAVEKMLDREYAARDRKSRQEGRKEGRREGKQEGKKEAVLILAKKMVKEKIDINLVMKITGLNKEQLM